RITGETAEQVRQVILRLGRVLEAGWKLREQGAELAGGGHRIDATPKFVEVRVVGPHERVESGTEVAGNLRPQWFAGTAVPGDLRPDRPRDLLRHAALEHRGVRELLIQLDGEFEIGRRPISPSAADL